MGWLNSLFGGKGSPIDSATVVKRMSASKRDFDGAGLDAENHPSNVFECGDIAITTGGKTRVRRLYQCRDTVAAACVKLKKGQAEMFYVSPAPFPLEFGWRNGGRVKMTARIDRSATSLPDWLMANIKTPGENVEAEAFGRLLDGKFSSENQPDWLVATDREDIAEPEPPSEPPSPTVADLRPGVVVFGHYRIEKELGIGGQGMVFLATDMQTVVDEHRLVVLKALRCENCGDETSLHEFIKEANTLSALRDDRIAACYWCKLLGTVPILAMEYVEGDSLDKYLANRKDGKIGETEARELLLPMAEALDYAHAKGIFHRDVKPQNIIVRKEPKKIGDKTIRTCLLDFGIASRDQAGGSQTSFWSVRGTLQYMSPEQKMIGRRPSASMDVYSLAVTAYECVTGNMPYPSGWERNARPTPLSSNTPFARAVMRGLEMMPENRPSTCLGLIDPKDDVESVPPPPPPTPAPATSSPPPPPVPDDLKKLERPFVIYRQLLAQSATRIERDNPERAEWFRGAQGRLRDMTQDLRFADSAALVRFFAEVKGHAMLERMSPDDFFTATDRLVELRSCIPEKGGSVLRALKESIGC